MGTDKIPVSLVSYTNSKPFLYGLLNSEINSDINLTLDTPAECAHKLISGQASIGLVPVAAIEKVPNAKLITDFGIAATGKVDSVLLLSNVSSNKIENILLDYQSMTSVRLVKVLTEKFWNLNFKFIGAEPGFESSIKQTTAGVVIGDRALALKGQFPFVYDLSEEWYKFTKMPFVFARWVCNTSLPYPFLELFNKALHKGVNSLGAVITQLQQHENFNFNVDYYLRNSVRFFITKEMEEGMSKFLELSKTIK